MKMAKANATTKQMASCLRITEEECLEFLEVLGYIVKDEEKSNVNRTVWKMTDAGKRVGRVVRRPFRKVNLWDVYAYLTVSNLRGKKEGIYAYCDKCGMYLGLQKDFTFRTGEWECTRCGHLNDLIYRDTRQK